MASLRGCPMCTGSGPFRTKVHYARIADAFTDRGIFAPDIRDLAKEVEDHARKWSPVRTGRMRNLHYRLILPAHGYERDFYVGTRAGYAGFVLGGTAGNGTGYITGKAGGKYHGIMLMRPAPYSWFGVNDSRRFQKQVKGQKAQDNWLVEAMRFVVRMKLSGGRG